MLLNSSRPLKGKGQPLPPPTSFGVEYKVGSPATTQLIPHLTLTPVYVSTLSLFMKEHPALCLVKWNEDLSMGL